MLDHKGFLIGLEDLKEMRLKKAQLEEKVKEINGEIGKEVYDLVEYMEATDQLSVKVKGLGTCSLTSTKQYSIDKEDERSAGAFEQFVRDRGEWGLVTAVHGKKLSSYYKEKLELNEELPPGIKTFIKTNITIRGI